MQIVDFEFIKDKNIFGLSNTAIKLEDIKKFIIPDTLIAVDWYIFSLLLIKGNKAVFTNETVSYYRQYEQNTVGLKNLDEKSFLKALEVKQKHYKALSSNLGFYNLELKRLSNIGYEERKNIKNALWWELI